MREAVVDRRHQLNERRVSSDSKSEPNHVHAGTERFRGICSDGGDTKNASRACIVSRPLLRNMIRFALMFHHLL